jgi:hypothetical protein
MRSLGRLLRTMLDEFPEHREALKKEYFEAGRKIFNKF